MQGVNSPLGRAQVRIAPYGLGDPTALVSRAGATSSIAGEYRATLTSRAGAASSISGVVSGTLISRTGARSSGTGVLTVALPPLTSRAGARSYADGQYRATLTSRAGAASHSSGALLLFGTLTSRAGARSSSTVSNAILLGTLTSRAGAKSSSTGVYTMLLVSRAGAASSSTGVIHALLSPLVSQAGAKSSSTGTLFQFGTLLSRAGAGSSSTGVVHLLGTLLSRAGAKSSIFFSSTTGAGIEVWVVNTRTGGVSRYTALPESTLAVVNGRLLIAASSGLYELTGADDNGTPIVASITTGRLDFGTHFLKRVEAVNVGYESSGRLEVQPEVDRGGVDSSPIYKTPRRQIATAPRDGVVKIGKGIKGRYWKFRIGNHLGSSFKIDTLDIHPIITSRRR